LESNWLTILGFVAAVLTSTAFVPQVVKIWKTNDTNSISLSMFLMFTSGILCWLVYGIFKKDIVITIANIATLSMCSYILFKKMKV
jgi:MtN3 and saliva related transmembrane protein